MIKFEKGDLFSVEVDALVNTVNCVGVMGKGIALQFRRKFPDNYKAYKNACKKNEVQLGKMFIFEKSPLISPKLIINFPTKRHWRDKSQLKDIDSGLNALIDDIERLKIKSIAVPALGCGNGGLNWSIVKQKIEKTFANRVNITAYVFEPEGADA